MPASSEELAERVHSVALRILRRVREDDPDSALSAARFSALSVLAHRGALTVGELAAAERVSAPTMSRLVTALEREEYVSREPDPTDGRRVRVTAKQAGMRALNEARRNRVERIAALLEEIESGERDAIREAAAVLESVLATRAAPDGD